MWAMNFCILVPAGLQRMCCRNLSAMQECIKFLLFLFTAATELFLKVAKTLRLRRWQVIKYLPGPIVTFWPACNTWSRLYFHWSHSSLGMSCSVELWHTQFMSGQVAIIAQNSPKFQCDVLSIGVALAPWPFLWNWLSNLLGCVICWWMITYLHLDDHKCLMMGLLVTCPMHLLKKLKAKEKGCVK